MVNQRWWLQSIQPLCSLQKMHSKDLKGVNRVSKRPNIDHIPNMDPNFPKEDDVFWICLDA